MELDGYFTVVVLGYQPFGDKVVNQVFDFTDELSAQSCAMKYYLYADTVIIGHRLMSEECD